MSIVFDVINRNYTSYFWINIILSTIIGTKNLMKCNKRKKYDYDDGADINDADEEYNASDSGMEDGSDDDDDDQISHPSHLSNNHVDAKNNSSIYMESKAQTKVNVDFF